MKALKEVSIGLLLGIVSISFSSFFNEQQQLEIWVILLVVIASIYIGFGINDGRKTEMLTEVTFGILFIVVAFLGLWVSVWILIGGYFLHGIWDLVHRPSMIETNVQKWYPPFCMVYDWTIAIWLMWSFS